MAGNGSLKGIAQTFSGLNVLVGIWLLAAPWVLGYGEVPTALWNDRIVGGATLLFAGIRVFAPARVAFFSWLNVVLGIWLVASPFVLQYGEGFVLRNVAFWNDLLSGLAIIALAWLSADATRQLGSPFSE